MGPHSRDDKPAPGSSGEMRSERQIAVNQVMGEPDLGTRNRNVQKAENERGWHFEEVQVLR